MSEQILGMPAKKNVIHLDFFRTEKAVITQTRPFTFFTEDECGVRRAFDLTDISFEMPIIFNECVQFLATTDNGMLKIGVGDSTNQIYIDIPVLGVSPGVYDYELNVVSTGAQVLKGKFTVNK